MNITDLFIRPLIDFVFSAPEKGKKTAKQKASPQPPKLSFESFEVKNFKGIETVRVDLARNGLVLLLGLNESGKTTILKAIEAFSYLNDPSPDFDPAFFQKIRKKSAINKDIEASITATIKFDGKLPAIKAQKLWGKELTEGDIQAMNGFIHDLNKHGIVEIKRVFPFKNGTPRRYFYRIVSPHPFASDPLANFIAQEIVSICPFIIYFEDFKDQIPEKIFIRKERQDSFDPSWYDIIDGLFYNTDQEYSIESFRKFFSRTNPLPDDASTVETRVNSTLNKTFTTKWKNLSGVKEIEKTVLKYNHHSQTPHFTLKVVDSDGTTYSVDERSKGALWYLSFLMKTEFRSKKMRKHSGKPVFLIDEPASNLHSTAQGNMINDFRKLAQDTSIVYTTHSQYLISTQNIKNTYIIERDEGIVEAIPWGQYLSRQNAQVSYYQPLANLLNIVPTTFDVPWRECVITEGPSDRHVLISLFRLLNDKEPPFVIYPGTGAESLDQLISLNLGWNSSFVVLLDADQEGRNAGKRYKEEFQIDSEVMYLPSDSKKIEKCFSKNEMLALRSVYLPSNSGGKVTKKEFAAIWGILASEDAAISKKVKHHLSSDTLARFKIYLRS